MELRAYDSNDLDEFVKGATKNESVFKKHCLRKILEEEYDKNNIIYIGYAVYEGIKLLARCLVWRVDDKDFLRESNEYNLGKTYYIGYLDCVDNQVVFDFLVKGILVYKNNSKIIGPVDFFDCLDSGVSKNNLYDYPSYYAELFTKYSATWGPIEKFKEVPATTYLYCRYNPDLYKDYIDKKRKTVNLDVETNPYKILQTMCTVLEDSYFKYSRSIVNNYLSLKYCYRVYYFYLSENKNNKKLKMYKSEDSAYLLTTRDGTDVTVWGMDGVSSYSMRDTIAAFFQVMLKKGYNVIWKCNPILPVPYSCEIEQHSFYIGDYDRKKFVNSMPKNDNGYKNCREV